MGSTQSSIKSEEKTIRSILSEKSHLRVPTYQRNFSWGKPQISDLIEDIKSIYVGDHERYFLGSMVLIQKSDNTLDVVDGQQRLATLSLLLAAIRDGFSENNDKDRANYVETNFLCSRNLRTLETTPKLELNETDNDLYWQIIDSKKKYSDLRQMARKKQKDESLQLIAQAYVSLYEFAKAQSENFKNNAYLSKLVEVVADNISCIQVVTCDEDSAYVLFETLNDRGIDLTLSDMLKNFLLSKAGRRVEEVKSQWNKTVEIIGQKYMKTFIRHEWMSKYGHTRERELYKRIKSEISDNSKALSYVSSISESAVVYDATQNPAHDLWVPLGKKCQSLLAELRILGPIQCKPLILAAYQANPHKLYLILEWIASLTVRYSIICAKGTGNLETAYAKASSTISKNATKLQDVKEIILSIYPNDDEFKSAFKEKTLGTPEIIKYVFTKMEMTLSSQAGIVPSPESLSVEHILSRKPGNGWPSLMRKDDFIKKNLNKIGNLTILTETSNREAQSHDFSFKKNIYAQSSYQITQELCSVENWTESSIDERQSRLANIAAATWAIS